MGEVGNLTGILARLAHFEPDDPAAQLLSRLHRHLGETGNQYRVQRLHGLIMVICAERTSKEIEQGFERNVFAGLSITTSMKSEDHSWKEPLVVASPEFPQIRPRKCI